MRYKVKCSICDEYTTVNRFPGKGIKSIKCERCIENGKNNIGRTKTK